MAETDSKPYGFIYCVTNATTGKQYIGQTKATIQHRWNDHCRAKNGSLLSRAVTKYGRDTFTVAQIASALSKDELNEAEAFYVIHFGTLSPNGYNLKHGGGAIGKWSDELHQKERVRRSQPEAIEKMVTASKAMWRDPAIRLRISTAIKKGLADPGVKKMRSEKAKIACAAQDVKDRMSAAQKVRFKDPAQRAEIGRRNLRRFQDPDAKAKFIQHGNQYRSDPSNIAKISERTKLQWSDPKQREALLLAHKNRKASVWPDETKAKQQARMAAVWADPAKRAERLAKIAASRAAKKAV